MWSCPYSSEQEHKLYTKETVAAVLTIMNYHITERNGALFCYDILYPGNPVNMVMLDFSKGPMSENDLRDHLEADGVNFRVFLSFIDS